MVQPEFGEAQLQFAANLAILRAIYGNYPIHYWPLPIIPTLPEEFDLGWDTGFFFNWLPLPRPYNNGGCNFFIQYKLSNEYNSTQSRLYKHWHSSYFNFRIPHRKERKDDFHQFDNLRAIAKKGYSVFYATNSFIKLSELGVLYKNSNLLNRMPFLDVSKVKRRHVHVSFTTTSSNFLLHSRSEEINMAFWEGVQSSLNRQEPSPLGKDNENMFALLKQFISDLYEGVSERIDHAYHQINEIEGDFRPLRKFLFLRSAFFQILGLHLHRYVRK
ncbi:MAG: hypothetical protein ACRER0_00435 [Gammaproteobacteria bacterium]